MAQTDLANGIIYLANTAPETMMHELLHATTAKVIFDFYENPDQLSKEQKDAIKNLENLMGQFMGLDFSAENANTREVARTVRKEISNYLQNFPENVGKAAALQEFMAWSLTNQNLADSLRTTKVRTPLMKIAHNVLMGLKRLLGLPHGQSLDIFSNVLWNTGALIQMSGRNRQTAAQRAATAPTGLLLDQVSPNTDRALKQAQINFERKIAQHVRALKPIPAELEPKEIRDAANQTFNLVTSSGFTLDPQQASAFSLVPQLHADSAFKQERYAIALICQAQGIHTNSRYLWACVSLSTRQG
ncbi:hypothetical protein [Seohaeicola sp.]|uniref:hypothetical protein n=1 Tax=Seohaeicola sp. TaxID=2042026 RepID=UPI003A888E4F